LRAEKRAEPFALGGCDDEGALAAITFPILVAAFIAWPCLEKRTSPSSAAAQAEAAEPLWLVAALRHDMLLTSQTLLRRQDFGCGCAALG
jgi:hypothetical protein